MHDNVYFDNNADFSAKIKVVGVGGGGCNAVNSLLDKQLNAIEFFALNTDAQALMQCRVPNKIAIGRDLTGGRGAGGDASVGARAAMDAREEITRALTGADMVFIAAGMGGGTGTGAAPVVAEVAKELGILTIAVVSRPFRFEGPKRMRTANEGLERLRDFVDTCITVSNDRLLEVSGKGATLQNAFEHANHVLFSGVSSINDLISRPGLINVDFADVRAIMNKTGGAVLGVGSGKGENRSSEAVTKATKSPLLDKIAIDGAKGVLICVTGGDDMAMQEVSDAVTMVYEQAAPDAEIIFGAVIDPTIEDEFRVTIIATGFDDRSKGEDSPQAAAGVVRPAPRPAPVQAPAPAATPTAQVMAPRPTPVPAPQPAQIPPSSASSGSVPAADDPSKSTNPRIPRAPGAGNMTDEDLETPPYIRRRKTELFDN